MGRPPETHGTGAPDGAPRFAVLIPALNEADTIPRVLGAIPEPFRARVVVVDNGSTDATPEAARRAGALVVFESRRGYGAACLRGLAEISREPPRGVVFLDADLSDDPGEMPSLVEPILSGRADLVVGSRVLGRREPGALTPQARFGNALATALIRLLFGARFTDLGPFRAVTWDALKRIDMQDRGYGWTVEMQVKAARRGLRCEEVPVSYRRRAGGRSKVSGTVRGVIGAGAKILYVIFREAFRKA